MPEDGTLDKFQVIGAANDSTDAVDSTGAGSATVPAPADRGTHYPIGGGAPATVMIGATIKPKE